jgi:hypothetical protein
MRPVPFSHERFWHVRPPRPLIEQASLPQQRVLRCELARREAAAAPALLIIGEVTRIAARRRMATAQQDGHGARIRCDISSRGWQPAGSALIGGERDAVEIADSSAAGTQRTRNLPPRAKVQVPVLRSVYLCSLRALQRYRSSFPQCGHLIAVSWSSDSAEAGLLPACGSAMAITSPHDLFLHTQPR